MELRTAAILPVAGLSSRMGFFKPLATLSGYPMIRLTMQAALDAGVDEVVVVCGKNSDAVHLALKSADDAWDSAPSQMPQHRVHFVYNSAFASNEMLDSVKLGLGKLLELEQAGARLDAAFVIPGDIPAVNPQTYSKLIAHQQETGAPVCIPSRKGITGHPVLFTREVFDLVLAYTGPGGLRGAITPLVSSYLETDDKGVTLDADTFEDFQQLQAYLEHISANPSSIIH